MKNEVGSKILGDKRAVALRQHHDLLLNVFDLILGLFQVNDFDGNDLLSPFVDSLKHLAKGSFPDPLLLREDELRVDLGLLSAQASIGEEEWSLYVFATVIVSQITHRIQGHGVVDLVMMMVVVSLS